MVCCTAEQHGCAAGQDVQGLREKPAGLDASLPQAEGWLSRHSLPGLPAVKAAREAQKRGRPLPPGHRGGRSRQLHDGGHDRRGEHSAQLRGPGAADGVLRGRQRIHLAPGQAVLRQPGRRSHPHQDAGLRPAAGGEKHRPGWSQEADGPVDRRRAGVRAGRPAARPGGAVSGEDR